MPCSKLIKSSASSFFFFPVSFLSSLKNEFLFVVPAQLCGCHFCSLGGFFKAESSSADEKDNTGWLWTESYSGNSCWCSSLGKKNKKQRNLKCHETPIVITYRILISYFKEQDLSSCLWCFYLLFILKEMWELNVLLTM